MSSLPLMAAGPAEKPSSEIWDAHCHLYSMSGHTPQERVGELIRFGDRMGIQRFVVFMGFPFYDDPTPEQLREQNDQVLRAMREFPHRVFGFVYLNPN